MFLISIFYFVCRLWMWKIMILIYSTRGLWLPCTNVMHTSGDQFRIRDDRPDETAQFRNVGVNQNIWRCRGPDNHISGRGRHRGTQIHKHLLAIQHSINVTAPLLFTSDARSSPNRFCFWRSWANNGIILLHHKFSVSGRHYCE